MTWLNLGNLERRAGRVDSALAAYRQATRADSSFGIGYLAEIQVLRERGKDDAAVETYRRWLRAMPLEHGARLSAVELLQTLHRPDEALVLAQEGLRVAPEAGAPHVVYGMALAGRGRMREALQQLRTGQSYFESDPGEQAHIESLVRVLRARAPDSLRAVFRADSLQAAAARAARDSITARNRRKR